LYRHVEEESHSALHAEDNTLALVQSDGTVTFVPVMTLVAHCEMDFTYWPVDSHVCKLEFGPWTYSSYQVNLKLYQEDYKSVSESS
jgi:hypothetical protein